VWKEVLCVVKCKVIEISRQVSYEEQIESRKQEITDLYRKCFTEKYKNKCNEFLIWLEENELQSIEAKRFCYLMITYYFCDVKEFEKALYSAEYALKYSEGLDVSKVYQMIGIIYKELGNERKSLHYLNKSFTDYKAQNLYFEMAQIYDIKGELLSSESMFKKAIKYYGQAENMESSNEREYDYNKFKNRAYKRLLKLYIRNGEEDFVKCYKLYNQIQDAAVKKETKEMIKAAYGKEV
jgi:tetratricopeptide (TPR) repeat protein